MTRKHLLFFTTAILTIWNAALIWMTQVLCYPLWPMVGSAEFHTYHLVWWHRVWWTFLPAGLALVGCILLLFQRPQYFPRWAAAVAAGAQILTLAATLAFWAPLQAGLATGSGLDLAGFHTLLWTHWFRVALIWVPAAVMTRTLAQRVSEADI